MAQGTWIWLFFAICAAAQIVTILTVVVAWRSRERRRRLIIRAAIAAVAPLFATVFTWFALMAQAYKATADADASAKAALLADGIAEAMNCAALGVLSWVFPTIVTIWLVATRAPQQPSAAGW